MILLTQNNFSDRYDFEELKDFKNRARLSTHFRTSEFLTPKFLDKKFDENNKKSEVQTNSKLRSTSLSIRSTRMKRKTEDLTKLYEFEGDDDIDPFGEIYN